MENRENWELTPDGVEGALAHLMPRSAGAVIREAFYGAQRFEEFLRRTSLTRSVLSAQLEKLVDAGMLMKIPYQVPGQRMRQQYDLTDRGRDMGVALIALIDWSHRWLPQTGGPYVEPQHLGCGALVHTVLRCEAGHDLLDIAAVGARVH